jgi:acyl-coenzyme A thioesterase PaaI-like protein
MTTLSLQEEYAPDSICYGCGPKNPQGLQLKSFVIEDTVISHFTPQTHHHAFPNVLFCGTIASILDCHSNWSACWYLMQHLQVDTMPCVVTSDLRVKYLRPTPTGTALEIKSSLHSIGNKKVIVKAELSIDETIHDQATGTFIAVDSSHPAYHRQ